jgi:restriction system protein
MEKEKTFWGIPAGQTGDAESLFDKKNVIAIGWEKMGDLSTPHTRAECEEMLRAGVPGAQDRRDPGQLRATVPVRPRDEGR